MVDIPDNTDGLWRVYCGSAKYHRYDSVQLISCWQRQEALCGRVTKTGNGSFSKLGPVPHGQVCRQCEVLLDEELADERRVFLKKHGWRRTDRVTGPNESVEYWLDPLDGQHARHVSLKSALKKQLKRLDMIIFTNSMRPQ